MWAANGPIGAMIGFFEGIAVAFFVVPFVMLLHVPEGWVWAGRGLCSVGAGC
jgi:hypothetical protein